ncbi:MAG: FtsX-like permease family protein, partial [Solirubrobacteraceae bacterium]
MGRLLVVSRLVVGDIRRRRLQSVLLVVMIVATTTTLTIGLALRHVDQAPFAQTQAATLGPDATVQVAGDRGGSAPSARQFDQLAHAPGVSATVGPFPVASVRLRAASANVPVFAVGRDTAPAAIDRPRVVAGSWLRPGGVVLERGLASTLGLRVGERLRLGTQAFTVSGIAVSTGQPFYPAQSPGAVWIARAAATALATRGTPLGYLLELRMKNAGALDTFLGSDQLGRFARGSMQTNQTSVIDASSFIEHEDYRLVNLNRKVLNVGSWLLAMLALASIAVLVGGRMAQQAHRVGLLKAVGATPGLVATVLLSETVTLALLGAGVGLIAGDLIAPSLAPSSHGLLGHTATPGIDAGGAVLVVVLAVAVAAAASIVPAIRGARASTLRALQTQIRPRRRSGRVIALSGALPAAMLLALRLVARRPRRTLLTAAGLMIAVAMVVAAITVEHDMAVTRSQSTVGQLVSHNGVTSQANHVLILLSVALVILASVTATFTAWATVVDAQRATALARALGATPRQVSAGLTVAQLIPALGAACIGIPAGLLLYQAAGGK